LFICDNHKPDDLEFQMFPKHCLVGTPEAEIIPELAQWVRKDNVIPKQRYSGFFSTTLDARLKRLKIDKLIICGVCTNICVMHTASDARNRDYKVEVPTDCVATFDPQQHQWALQHMEKILGVKLVTHVNG
jgi:nicotinamidase-related amidase